MEPDQSAARPHPATNAIAQQYSSATFLSLRFHSYKEKLDLLLKKVIIYLVYVFKIV